MAKMLQFDEEARQSLERGVDMRTLYQHTARRSKATRDHVDRILEQGAQVRTLDEFFNRLIVVDRRLAVIPGGAPDVAVAIHEPKEHYEAVKDKWIGLRTPDGR